MRKLPIKNYLAEDDMMPHTNYCPSLRKAETEAPVVSKGNPRKYNASYTCDFLDDENCVLNVHIKDKKNKDVADVVIEYDTRDGLFKNNMLVQLADSEYGSANHWVKELRVMRRFVKALIHRFGELNNNEYWVATGRPQPVRSRENAGVKRPKFYSVDEWECKGYYRRSKLGTLHYVRAATCHPHI